LSGRRRITWVGSTLVPDVVIVDPKLALSMPRAITAVTGIDALTHALEAAVSIFAPPYTEALSVQATWLIFARVAMRDSYARPASRRRQRASAAKSSRSSAPRPQAALSVRLGSPLHCESGAPRPPPSQSIRPSPSLSTPSSH
jgi:alcohol dehydrogenase class IV